MRMSTTRKAPAYVLAAASAVTAAALFTVLAREVLHWSWDAIVVHVAVSCLPCLALTVVFARVLQRLAEPGAPLHDLGRAATVFAVTGAAVACVGAFGAVVRRWVTRDA